MAVFPDRIVLKNSADNQAQIEAAIGTGGTDEITQGELVIGLEASSVSLYTLDANGGIVRFNPSSSQGRAIVSDTEPTTGLGGAPLIDGDMWFNGSDDSYYIYEAGVWVQVVTSTAVPSLNDILDVSVPNLDITEDGYVLTWDDVQGLWVAGAPAALGEVSLNGLTDVTYIDGVFVPAGMVDIRFNTGGSTMDFRLPAGYSGNRTYDLPPNYGTPGQALLTDGAGAMTWGDVASGGTSSIDDLTDVDTSTTPPTIGQVLEWDGTSWVPADAATGGGGGGGSTGSRLSEGQTASSGAATFTGLGHSGTFVSVTSSLDAWIVFYGSAADRTSDAGRSYSTDPTTGSGVLAEFYVTAGGTVLATPGTNYFNNDTSVTEALYVAVRDQAGASVDSLVTVVAYGNQAITAASARYTLGIGEYADDAAAGTGGVASGAMYYNTTSSDYRLKS